MFRRSSSLLALGAASLGALAHGETLVLEPVDSGTQILEWTIAGGGTPGLRLAVNYDNDRLSTFYRGNTIPPGSVQDSPATWTRARTEFDLSPLDALEARATIISVKYVTRRRTANRHEDLEVAGYVGSGEINSQVKGETVRTVTAAAASAGVSVGFTDLVRSLRAAKERFVGFQVSIPRVAFSQSIEDLWYQTGEFRPVLKIEYTPKATFTSLGSLQSRGFYSSARALSPDGGTVVGVTDSITGDRAFVWNAARGMFDIGAGAAGASGVASGGNVVVGRCVPGGYRWQSSGTGAWFGSDALAVGVSSDATAVVGSSLAPGGIRSVYRWTSNTTERYDTYVGSRVVPAQAAAISANGRVFVGSTLPYNGAAVPTRAFVWNTSGGQMAIPALPGGTGASEALGVSGDGTSVVGWSWGSRGPEAFRWTSAGIVGLGNLRNPDGTLGNASRANAISPDGAVVVGAGVSGERNRAFVWDAANGAQSLQDLLTAWNLGADLAGWTLYDAVGVTVLDDGAVVVVGSGYDPLGRTQAFYATLPRLQAPNRGRGTGAGRP